ncbi:CAP domain-containing protein [Streptomyces coffeae]|uniref:CAP domain-containing protein n=1 Tax=Streptomyces coffeae TaxID=621382 RepID=UPI0027DD450C|nr:CAP domain-containing protein [Streptomyces coffeae]
MRTGLLGMSAAVAVGAVAMASGLLPGGGHQIGGGNDSAGQVQAEGPADTGLGPQGTQSPSPSLPGQVPAGQGGDRSQAPSTSPSKPSEPSRPSTPSTSPSDRPGSPGSSDRGGDHDRGRGGGKGSSDHDRDTPPPSKPADPPADTSAPDKAGGREAAAEKQVLARVNKERAKVGCSPVTLDPKLSQLADDFSDDMSLRDFFDHVNPDGESPWERAERAGIVDLGGENIARGQSTAKDVMDTWMDSSSHRANILNCEYTTMGVGAHFDGDGPWWTQDFGF